MSAAHTEFLKGQAFCQLRVSLLAFMWSAVHKVSWSLNAHRKRSLACVGALYAAPLPRLPGPAKVLILPSFKNHL